MSRRLMLRNGSGGSGGLPSGYRQVDCVSFLQGAYIDTNVPVVTGDIISATARLDSDFNLYPANPVFHVNIDKPIDFALEKGKRPYLEWGSSYKYFGELDHKKHRVQIDSANGTFTYDDAVSSFSQGTLTAGTMTLSARHIRSGYNSFTATTFWSFSIENNGVYRCNLVPCQKLSSGEYGFFDTVTREFRANQGTASIVEGVESCVTPN